MVFSSPTFLFLFLPAVLLATWLSPTPLRRFVLLGASLVFYAWGVQEFVFVVIASTLFDWALARGIARRHRGDPGHETAVPDEGDEPHVPTAQTVDRWRHDPVAKICLLVGLFQNLSLLAYFKYGGFASEQAERLADVLGLSSPGTIAVALPIGISFFTFEKISYLVDVWRGDVEARRDPLDVLLFVALFPRAIAGPIVRLREIAPDLRRPKPTVDLASAGALRFTQGLAKKVLIADQIAPIADACFASAGDGSLTMGAAWLGALAYALQLYFDFSGYSDMAIGIGMMLGFRLPENFNRPYSAYSVTDFWRRWHMTLSRWFRDYVYIPLGGNRGSERATERNLIIVFALTGLWHGAAWAFVLWGLYHGAWLLLERRMGWRAVDGPPRWPVARRAVLLIIVILGWVLFRAESLDLAADYYRAMVEPTFGLAEPIRLVITNQAIAAMLLGTLVCFLPRDRSAGWLLTEEPGRTALVARTLLIALVLPASLAAAFSSSFSPFLYFQF
ncbi:MAG: MBOAT family protein [Solirubrobacteraceae bacterium]|nr:MBOAT family protein [Solirubrobacteraceae bacterium]